MNSQKKYPENLLSKCSSETELVSPFLEEVFAEAQLLELENLKTPSDMLMQESPFLNVFENPVLELGETEAQEVEMLDELDENEGEESEWLDGETPEFEDYQIDEDLEDESDRLLAEENLEVEWDRGSQELYEEQFEEEVFGINDMDSVSNTLAVPHRWICRLDIEFEITPWNSTRTLTGRGRGTGTLISPCHILTAAHNLSMYDPVRRNFLRATRIRVTAAHDGSGTPPVASVDADMSNSHIHPRWVVRRRVTASGASNAAGEVATNRYDYALLTLTRSIGQSSIRALGAPLGYWARQGSGGTAIFERLSPNLIKSNPATVSGYGFDACVIDVRRVRSKPAIPLGSSLTASGNITLIWEGARPRYIGRSMAHNADTCGGQSGGPVWLLHNKKHYLVGVHTGGVGLTNGRRINHAVRVTNELIKQVNAWMTRSPCPMTTSAREHESSFEDEALYLDEEREGDESGADRESLLREDCNGLQHLELLPREELFGDYADVSGLSFVEAEEEVVEGEKFSQTDALFSEDEPLVYEDAEYTAQPEQESEEYLDEEQIAKPFDELAGE